MDAIDALTRRVSAPRLTAPAPSAGQRADLRRAALRAADHGNLRPWRFLEIEGEGLLALGRLYEAAALAGDGALSASQRERLRGLPLRAPLLWVAIARLRAHAKVPECEQLIAAGCAVQNMLNAAFALGVGAYWRTGELAYNRDVAAGLGLAGDEQIVGFLYLGRADGELRPAPELDPGDFFRPWPEPR